MYALTAVTEFVQLVGLPLAFRWKLLALMAGNAVASYLLQYAARAALALGRRLRAGALAAPGR